MEPGKSLRRPSEIITSLRKKAEEERQAAEKAKTTKAKQQRQRKQQGLIKVGKNARFCPAGHCFARTLVQQQQCYIQQKHGTNVLDPIICNGCSIEIVGEYITGCCKTCNLNFCEDCFLSSKSIEEMIEETSHSTVTGGGEASISEITMDPTNEYCAAGHHLGRVAAVLRRRYLQEQNGLDAPPTIECDCCSKTITNEYIAGCCFQCDLDFCENCFKNGQSYQDILEEDRTGGGSTAATDDYNYDYSYYGDENDDPRDNPRDHHDGQQRYNSRRPTYKGTGRVNYDSYPDPTAYQWTFTGSNETRGIEYFEKDYGRIGIIKLDFYYAIGTARTILEHPVKGEMRLFGKKKTLRPTLYRKILLDPKTHTDRHYRKKAKQVL